MTQIIIRPSDGTFVEKKLIETANGSIWQKTVKPMEKIILNNRIHVYVPYLHEVNPKGMGYDGTLTSFANRLNDAISKNGNPLIEIVWYSRASIWFQIKRDNVSFVHGWLKEGELKIQSAGDSLDYWKLELKPIIRDMHLSAKKIYWIDRGTWAVSRVIYPIV